MSTSSPDPAGAAPPPPPTSVGPPPGPPVAGDPVDRVAKPPTDTRPGDLTGTWRLLLGSAWVLAFFAYAAIWNASVQIGIGTWWIGPRGEPTSVIVKVLPFVVCIVVIIGVLYQPRRLLGLSALATGLLALGSIPDYSRSVGLGIAETVVAALLAIVTAAATTGRYRLATVPPGPADRRSDGSGVPSEPTDGPTSQGPPRMLPPPQR